MANAYHGPEEPPREREEMTRFLRHDVASSDPARRNAMRDADALDLALEHEADETEHRRREVARLAALHDETVAHPFRHAVRIVLWRVLHALGKATPPLSARRAGRFARSAEKRDPVRARRVDSLHATRESYTAILAQWAEQRAAAQDATRALADRLASGPRLSLIVAVRDPDPRLLQATVDSVVAQSYPNWELCLAEDALSGPDIREILDRAAASDDRVRVASRDGDGTASTRVLALATGAFVLPVEQDGLLDPDALLNVADCLDAHPDARIVYTDHDRVRVDGFRHDPQFKPDWNRELLYGYDYIGHLRAFHAATVARVGGFRVGMEAVEGYDLLLRCLAHVEDGQIRHIPRVLYSARPRRAAPEAWDAGVRAVSEALSARHERHIPVEKAALDFAHVPQWPLDEEPPVTILIPTRDRLDITRVAVESILRRTRYDNYRIALIDNASTDPATLDWFGEVARLPNVDVLRDDGPFNYSALNNRAVAKTGGDILALVNNDIEVISEGWLREMVALAIRPDVGCVGAKLLYPDDTVQHAGVLVGLGGGPTHVWRGRGRGDPGYAGRLALRQEYAAVTAACLVMRRDVYEEVGGLNAEDLAVAYNDVDLCLKVQEAGYRNLWTPHAELYHYESASRKTDTTPEKKARFLRELDYMVRTWDVHGYRDAAYNPNLSREHDDFRFGPAQW